MTLWANQIDINNCHVVWKAFGGELLQASEHNSRCWHTSIWTQVSTGSITTLRKTTSIAARQQRSSTWLPSHNTLLKWTLQVFSRSMDSLSTTKYLRWREKAGSGSVRVWGGGNWSPSLQPCKFTIWLRDPHLLLLFLNASSSAT